MLTRIYSENTCDIKILLENCLTPAFISSVFKKKKKFDTSCNVEYSTLIGRQRKPDASYSENHLYIHEMKENEQIYLIFSIEMSMLCNKRGKEGTVVIKSSMYGQTVIMMETPWGSGEGLLSLAW